MALHVMIIQSRNVVVPMIDSLRFLSPACYSIYGILEYLVWMETRDHDKYLCSSIIIKLT